MWQQCSDQTIQDQKKRWQLAVSFAAKHYSRIFKKETTLKRNTLISCAELYILFRVLVLHNKYLVLVLLPLFALALFTFWCILFRVHNIQLRNSFMSLYFREQSYIIIYRKYIYIYKFHIFIYSLCSFGVFVFRLSILACVKQRDSTKLPKYEPHSRIQFSQSQSHVVIVF